MDRKPRDRSTYRAKEPIPLAERYWARVGKGEGCWLFAGKPTSKGYGRIRLGPEDGSRNAPAHRVAWFFETGEWPPADLFVCHTCDVPNCVRPDHLFLGTALDNNRDAAAKGRCLAQAHPERMARGERNGNSRLTKEIVIEMRRLHQAGWSIGSISDSLGLPYVTARKAVKGLTWAWL